MDIAVSKTIKTLNERNIISIFVETRQEACNKILDMVPEKSSIGIGGSITVQQLGLQELLKNKGCRIYWHWNVGDQEESKKIRRKAMNTDVYLCSSNAITYDGKLVNIDGAGNRIGAMVFGPKKSIIVVGTNKLVDSIESAIERIKTIACPQTAQRLKRKTPCADTGKCIDCNSPDRLCNVTSIIEGKPRNIDMYVVIVGEELGF